MIIAGVDVGNQTTKAVIVDGRRMVSRALVNTRGDMDRLAQLAVHEAAQKAGLPRGSIERVVSTGAGREAVTFADDSFTEITCGAAAAHELFPSVRVVLDVGAEECRVFSMDEKGKVLEFFINDKCAAGVGMFIEIMAKALGVSLEEACALSLKSSKDLDLSTSCTVFAESEVISLINGGESKADVLRSIHLVAATKATALLRRLGMKDSLVLMGGVALNAGFIDSLRHMVAADIRIPEDPQVTGAFGAALLAGRVK